MEYLSGLVAARQLVSVGASVYLEKLKTYLLGDVREHPSIISVQISVFARTSKGKAVAGAPDPADSTREFIRLYDERGWPPEGIPFEDLLREFSGIPRYARIEAGSEIIIRYRTAPGSPKAYAVIFSHKDPIHFPPVLDPPSSLSFFARIVSAVAMCPDADRREVRDVSQTVVEFAGPRSDFYVDDRLPPVNCDRILWDVPDRFRWLCVTDSFGRQFAYDRETTVEMRFPPRNLE